MFVPLPNFLLLLVEGLLINRFDCRKEIEKLFIINSGASISNTFGKGVGLVHISRFYCSGSESQLLSCGYYIYSCSYSYHAGIKCEGIDH